MLQLLRIHMLDRLRLRLAAQHGELAFIDALGAELAGVIDADDAVDQLVLGQIARQAIRGGLSVERSVTQPCSSARRASVKTASASA